MSEQVLEQENETGYQPEPIVAAVSAVPAVAVSNRVAAVRHSGSLEQMSDVPVTLVFEVERLEISIRELLELKQGSLLKLPSSSLDSLKILVDGTPIAIGDVITERGAYGVRIDELLPLDGEEGTERPG